MKHKAKSLTGLEVINHSDYKNTPWVILLHGYGASAEDLYPLHRELDPEQKFNWLFPQAPLEIPLGPFDSGYAWWPLQLAEWQNATIKKDYESLSQKCPKELPQLRTLFDSYLFQYDLSWSQIVLGGFSQGAMLATDLCLHAPQSPRKLLIFSGSLICQLEWERQIALKKELSFFQSHGESDEVLSYGQAQKLYKILKAGGLQGSFTSFPGGHSFPPLSQIIKSRIFE